MSVVREHVVRRDENGNPICNRCNSPIIDPEYHFVMYHPDHPDIPIGPLHEECIPFIKLCSTCYRPCSLYKKDSGKIDEIRYLKEESQWVCVDCLSHTVQCCHCGKRMADGEGEEITGYGTICPSCVNNETFYCQACNTRHFNANSAGNLRMEELIYYKECLEHYQHHICATKFYELRDNFKKNNAYQCKCCKNWVKGRSLSGYCPSCRRSSRVNKCNHCGKYHHITFYSRGKIKDKIISVYICKECIKKVCVCPDCGGIYPISNFNSSPIKAIVDEIIHKVFDQGIGYQRIFINFLCDGCVKNYIHCPTCHALTKSVEDYHGTKYCTRCEDQLNLCERCHKPHVGELHCRPNSHILNYSYKPGPFFKIAKDEKFTPSLLFMGIENEVTFTDHDSSQLALQNITKYFGADSVYVKADASIKGRGGFEIVTSPMSYKYIKSIDWENSLFHGNNFIKHSSCGMHIHVNKSAFISIGHLFKFTKFFNTWDTLRTKVAGRDAVSYAQKIHENIASVCMKKNNTQRYSIVNHSPTKTIEIRIFSGATTAKEFLTRIEFTCAVFNFSMTASNKSTSKDFLKWLKSQKKEYPTLTSFIEGE